MPRDSREATKGARPEWYPVPSGVEKVAICRISGARATDACRHPVVAAVDSPALGDTLYPAANAAAETDSDEPPVYEDLFPAGTAPSETCTLHGTPVIASSNTPLVDAAIRHASARGEAAPGGSRLFVEKITGADGRVRFVIRER